MFSFGKLGENGELVDERYRIQASACGGCHRRVFTGGRIGAGANARRDVALRDRRLRQYARSEHPGLDPRSLCRELEHLRPAGFASAASSSTANGCSISARSPASWRRSYEVSPDGLKMTFRLRKDAKFQDGSPVTAEDVKWSLDRVVTAPVARQGAAAHGLDDLGRPVQGDRSPDRRGDAAEAGQAGAAQSRHRLSDHHQLQARQANTRRQTIPGRRPG